MHLIDTLQKSKDAMELSKQHQLYGAIKEIENFLEAIEFYRQEQLKSEDFELKREGPLALSTRMALAFKNAGNRSANALSRGASQFNEKVIKGTGRAVKRTKKKIKLIREVTKEIKKRSKEDHEK